MKSDMSDHDACLLGLFLTGFFFGMWPWSMLGIYLYRRFTGN